MLVLASMGVRASTNNWGPAANNFYFNRSSFSSYYGEDVQRTLDVAMRSWNWAAGTKMYFNMLGDTTATTCNWFSPSMVVGESTCDDPPACEVCGIKELCGLGTWAVRVYLPACGEHSLSMQPGKTTLLSTLAHELGHNVVGNEHVDPPGTRCVMSTNASDVGQDPQHYVYGVRFNLGSNGVVVGHTAQTLIGGTPNAPPTITVQSGCGRFSAAMVANDDKVYVTGRLAGSSTWDPWQFANPGDNVGVKTHMSPFIRWRYPFNWEIAYAEW